ncbi:MAG: DNA polymerase III subunit delta, partial [Pseudomonadales bacterium]
MQLKHGDLARHVEQGLLPAYLIAGDETLLVEEACDLVIAAARTQGFTERSVHFADGNFNWAEIIHDSASISLFAERKILDVRMRSNKFGDASEVIRSWTASADGETVLLIRCGRLDKNQRKSAWFKAIEAVGAVVLIWDMGPAELPRWLHGRLRDQGLQVEADAVAYLGERVEGNLLAADQEKRKLALLEI